MNKVPHPDICLEKEDTSGSKQPILGGGMEHADGSASHYTGKYDMSLMYRIAQIHQDHKITNFTSNCKQIN
jgi:hypothetical protein